MHIYLLKVRYTISYKQSSNLEVRWNLEQWKCEMECPLTKAHPWFGIKQGLIFTKNNLSRDVTCISPKAIHKGKQLIKIIIDHAYNIIGHFGQFKTAQYIRRYFWWPSMLYDIEVYCKTCSMCMTTKDTNSKLTGLLHSLPIPDRPWQSIGMDFLPKSNNFDYLLVIIDQLNHKYTLCQPRQW